MTHPVQTEPQLPAEGTYEEYMYNTCYNLERDGVPKEAIDQLINESKMFWTQELAAHSSALFDEIKTYVLGTSAAGVLDEYDPILDEYLDQLRSKLETLRKKYQGGV